MHIYTHTHIYVHAHIPIYAYIYYVCLCVERERRGREEERKGGRKETGERDLFLIRIENRERIWILSTFLWEAVCGINSKSAAR